MSCPQQDKHQLLVLGSSLLEGVDLLPTFRVSSSASTSERFAVSSSAESF